MAMVASTADQQLTRQCRRLYVGNLPVHLKLSESQLHELFQSTLIALGIATPQPVISAWVSAEGAFAFIEFRSVQDCTLALSLLQGMQIGGRILRIGRPQDFKLPPAHLANFVVGLPIGVGARQTQRDTQNSARRKGDAWMSARLTFALLFLVLEPLFRVCPSATCVRRERAFHAAPRCGSVAAD